MSNWKDFSQEHINKHSHILCYHYETTAAHRSLRLKMACSYLTVKLLRVFFPVHVKLICNLCITSYTCNRKD